MRFFRSSIRVIGQVAFALDGSRLLASGSNVPDDRYKPDNRGIDVWDLAGRAEEPVDRLVPNEIVCGFAIHPDGRRLYLGTGFDYPETTTSGYFAVDLARRDATPLGIAFGNRLVLAAHPSGEWLVGAGNRMPSRQHSLTRWRQPPVGPPVEEWSVEVGGRWAILMHLACDPKGDRIITQEILAGYLVDGQSYDLTVRDASSGEILEKHPIPGRTVHEILFSPCGSWLVVRAGPSLLVWDARDLATKPRKVKGGSRGHYTGLAFHPSGRFLAATSNDQSVTLYGTESWRIAATFDWQLGRMRAVAFSPDGSLVAAGSDSGRIVLWDFDV